MKASPNYSEAESARRRDDTIKRMLSTPPEPHQPLKATRAKRKKKAAKKPSLA